MCGIAAYVDFATGETSLPVLEAKRTLYRGIQQVEPGCFLEFDHRGIREGSPLYHPSLFFPRENDLSTRGIQGDL